MEVREATRDDRLDVRRVLDAAMLDVREDLPERIGSGDVLVAAEDGSVLGALVLISGTVADSDARAAHVGEADHAESAAHIAAVAVRRARRARGVGSALVRRAAEREGRLTAEFDPAVRPFYASLGFEISPVGADDSSEDGDRLRGEYEDSTR